MRALGLIAAVAFAMAAPAHADWQFTRWGMSLDEVVAAGEGRVARIAADQVDAESTMVGTECRAQINGPYELAGTTYSKVNLCFDGTGLARVMLYADEWDYGAVDRALVSALGEPVDETPLPSKTFIDREKGNTIRLLRFSVTVLEYTPRAVAF